MAIIPGSNSGETLTGTNGDDVITGLGGVDALYGLAGTDNLDGGLDGDYLDGGPGDDIMLGGAGDDVYYVDSAGDQITELANEGTDAVSSSVSIILGDNVENLYLTGTGAINGTGNALRNTIRDNAGINILAGGAGNDSYAVQNTGDQVIEQANEGTDYVSSTVSYAIADNIENLVLKGTANIDGTGNALNNSLTGNTGINVLAGAAGNDHYYVQNTGDQVVEQANGGTDFVHTSVDFTLPGNVEHMYLTGTGDINGTGNALANTIRDNAGINILAGGSGIDSYVVQNTDDQVIEQANDKDADYVSSSATFTLSANVEHLVLTGNGDIDGTGNELSNSITGNTGDNVLDGRLGSDRLTGGAGNDTFIVDSTGDRLTDSSGVDLVKSAVSKVLPAGFENLTLLGTAGLTGQGNASANVLTGNAGPNRLDGGAGADTMAGGLGNDRYLVDNKSDQVIEEGAGIDEIRTTVSFTLPDHVENVETGVLRFGSITVTGNQLDNTFTGGTIIHSLASIRFVGGEGNDTYNPVNNVLVIEQADEGIDTVVTDAQLYFLAANVENLVFSGGFAQGNELDNKMTGNSGNNGLDGREGNDILTGGEGTDKFNFDTALNATNNVDRLADFNVVDDTIQLDKTVFTGLADGVLAADRFHIGTAAADESDRVIYDDATGALFFDADGTGASNAVQFATLASALALTNVDFFVF